jgi:hypothetical protein
MDLVGRMFLRINPASRVHIANLSVTQAADGALNDGGVRAIERAKTKNPGTRIGLPNSFQVGPVERAENLARHTGTVVGPQVDHDDVRSWAINRRAGIDPRKTVKGRGNTAIGINAEAQTPKSNRAGLRVCQKSALIRPAAPPVAEPRPTVAGPASRGPVLRTSTPSVMLSPNVTIRSPGFSRDAAAAIPEKANSNTQMASPRFIVWSFLIVVSNGCLRHNPSRLPRR